MVFELTDALEQEILFAMEDQETAHAVDASRGCLVEAERLSVDENLFYALPSWQSGDGYALLSDFTNKLHSPLAREDLKRTLVGGRGVFRKFKDVLKSYPEIERKWHFYKDVQMRKRLKEWYNALRESWGLEKLVVSADEDTEETFDLLENDFMFREYDADRDAGSVSRGIALAGQEYRLQFSDELGEALTFLWQRQSGFAAPDEKHGFVCHTTGEEFTGCILVSLCPSSTGKTVVLTDFFVVQNYRGLGIGRNLLTRCLADLKSRGMQWLLIANTIIPEPMEPLLERLGFEKLGSGYLGDVRKL